jgi:hypothetical protein
MYPDYYRDELHGNRWVATLGEFRGKGTSIREAFGRLAEALYLHVLEYGRESKAYASRRAYERIIQDLNETLSENAKLRRKLEIYTDQYGDFSAPKAKLGEFGAGGV